MAGDLSYYGSYTAADLLEGACQAFMKACFAVEHNDPELLQEANDQQAKFSAALKLTAERDMQRYLQ